MDRDTAIVGAATATAALALVHVVVPYVRSRAKGIGEPAAAAVGGGVAAAYVFVHLLPELARGNEEVAAVIGDSVVVSGAAEVGLFVVALAGFLVLYGLDHVAERRQSSSAVFAVHLAVFALYNGLITYALPTRFEADVGVAVLFVVAMALHFVLSDRALAEHYGDRFRRFGGPVLVASLVGGFMLAWAFAPTRAWVFSLALAALGGFVLYNVFSDELPDARRVRYPTFAASAGVYAFLLMAVVAAE